MNGLELAIGIVLLVFAVITILIVLFQQGEQKNSGVIMGGSSDTYISKNSGRTIDRFLERWTRIFAVGFFLAVIAVNVILMFFGGHEYAESTVGKDEETSSSVTETVEGSEAEAETEASSAASEASKTSSADASSAA